VPGGGGLPIIGSIPFRGTAHNAATYFTQNYQNKLQDDLGRILQLAQTNPQAAQAELQTAWTAFLDGADQFIASQPLKQDAIQVVKQALSTPELTNTVNMVWEATGGQGGLEGLNQIIAGTSGRTGGIGKTIITYLPGLAALAGLILKGTTGGSGSSSTTPTQAGGNEQPANGETGATAQDGATGLPNPQDTKSWFDKYIAPYLPLALNAGLQLAGASSASNSAKEAAQIQADSAQKALDLQKQLYEEARSDLAPWRAAGQSGLQALSYGLGLPNPSTGQPFTQAPMSLSRVGAAPPQQFPQNVYGSRSPGSRSPVPNMDELAAKYRRG
jgi:hypothetical protein